MAMIMKKKAQAHAIMVCLHFQGHINPLYNLAIKLASKGFSITFALLESTHHQISRSCGGGGGGDDNDIFASARRSGLDIRCMTFSDGFPLDYDRASNILAYAKFLYDGSMDGFVDELVGKILCDDDCKNSFLVTDTLSVWWKRIAEKYGMVSVSLWTQGALDFSLLYHWQLMREKGHVPVNGRREVVDYLPGISSVNTKDFMTHLLSDEFHPQRQLVFEALAAVRSADFVLCNTVEEVEAAAVSGLQQQLPFYPIGPLFLSAAKSLLPETGTADWLSSRLPGSVLYVSFGSLVKADGKVVAAVAASLLANEGVSFLWVVRPGMVAGGAAALPEGFEERTRGRGLVVPWCSQIEVLRHPAVGGFLTHCGWNSVLESVWCGVPMICNPLIGDQITNRKIVVDDWRVGISLCDGEAITEEEVSEKIGVLMNEKSSRHLRREIEKMAGTFRNAVAAGGSSEANFDRFVEQLLKRCH